MCIRDSLYGEQIGQTLIAKAKNEVALICTDHSACLAAREFVCRPVLLLLSDSVDVSTATLGNRFDLGRNRAAISAKHNSDEDEARAIYGHLHDGVDLLEPFGRIREALEEAQKSVRPQAA